MGELTDNISPNIMEDYVNEELGDKNQNYLNEENKIGTDEEVGEK